MAETPGQLQPSGYGKEALGESRPIIVNIEAPKHSQYASICIISLCSRIEPG